jgi:hypothetical protein
VTDQDPIVATVDFEAFARRTVFGIDVSHHDDIAMVIAHTMADGTVVLEELKTDPGMVVTLKPQEYINIIEGEYKVLDIKPKPAHPASYRDSKRKVRRNKGRRR